MLSLNHRVTPRLYAVITGRLKVLCPSSPHYLRLLPPFRSSRLSPPALKSEMPLFPRQRCARPLKSAMSPLCHLASLAIHLVYRPGIGHGGGTYAANPTPRSATAPGAARRQDPRQHV